MVLDQQAPRRTEGSLEANVREGELFLKSESDAVYRLRWKRSDRQRKRALPAGEYKLLGYRLVEGEWFVSSTAGHRTVEVVAGETTRVRIDPVVRVGLKVRPRRGDRTGLGMSVRGHQGMGVSIYHKGKRIPIRYVLEDRKGKETSSGVMRYG